MIIDAHHHWIPQKHEDKITLGSDYPVGPHFLQPAVTLVQSAHISQQAKRKILGENAAKLFRISPRG